MRSIARILILAALTSPLVVGCESDPVAEHGSAPWAFAPKEEPNFPGPSGFVSSITNP